MSQDTSANSGSNTCGEPEAGLQLALQAIQRSALQLLSKFPYPPTALRIRAGEFAVEAEWVISHSAVFATTAAGVEPAVSPATEIEGDGRRYLHAPTVGVFYHASEPGAKPFISEGDMVVPGQQVGIIEAMKLMIPVKADLPGKVVEVLKENGAPVEYDDRLFAVIPLATS